MMRILIAEDDPRISQRLRDALTAAGFVVEHEADGDDAWHRGDTEDFDAIVLDLGLPSQDGLSILRQWRKAGRSAPVLILSARSQWDERVAGIELGADDYVTKPFRMEEVVARVRALIRRSAGQVSPQIEIGGGLMLDTRMMQVTRGGVPLPLTPQEYRLLAYLAHNKGRVVPQIEIVEHLYSQDFDRESNSVEVLVGRVRRRISPDIIRTRRGFGYVLGGADGE